MSVERAFETDSILLRDRTGLVTFDIDPLTVGFNAPIGSFGMRTNGKHYRKIDALDTDWTEIDGPKFLPFCNRAGVDENIAVVDVPSYFISFFNRADVAENLPII